MSYSINLLQDPPVLVSSWDSSFEFTQEIRAYSDEIKTILDARTEPLYYVMDFREWKDMSLENMMKAAEVGARSGNSNLHHPMTKGVLFITGSRLMEMAARGMKSDIYGNLDIRVFSTVDDALDFVKKQ
jgi:hypothetical protein